MLSTTGHTWQDGAVLLRDLDLAAEKPARELLASVAPAAFRPSSHEIDLREARLISFDADATGAPTLEAIDDQVLEVVLRPPPGRRPPPVRVARRVRP